MTAWSCPVPFKGETLFSVVARFYLRSGFISPQSLLKGVGQIKRQLLVSPLGGSFLSRMFQSFPEFGPVLDMEATVVHHTTAPLLLAFSEGCNDPKKRAEFVQTVGVRGGWLGAPRSSHLIHTDGLRFCVECGEQDIQDVGVPYWHREHQVKIVTHCWRHGTRLKEIRRQVGKQQALDVPPIEVSDGTVREVSVPAPVREELCLRIASAVAVILDSPQWSEPQGIRQIFLESADSLGLLYHGHPSRERIWRCMDEAYGEGFLSAMGLPTRYSHGVVRRYVAPFRASKLRFDPGVVILMASALGIAPEKLCQSSVHQCKTLVLNEEELRGNDADGQKGDKEVEEALIANDYIIGRTATALGIRRGQLVRRIVLAGIACKIVLSPNSRFSEAEIREMIELLRKGIPRKDVEQKFLCGSAFLDEVAIYDASLREDAKKARREKRRIENREVVMKFIRETVGVSRAMLWEDLPGPMSFLRRADMSWLCSTLNALPKQLVTVQVPSAGRGRVDDDEFDGKILKKLEAVRERVFELIPPRRVTASLAFRLAEVPPNVFDRVSSGRMPRTDAFLKMVTESGEDYTQRKLRYAFQQLAATRATVTATSLRLASGFTPEKLKRHLDFIHHLVNETGMPFSSRAARWLFK